VEDLEEIIFDVDNVLADTIGCWCKKASKHLGYAVSKKDIKSHKIVGSVSMPPWEVFRLQDEVWMEWKKLPPLESDVTEKLRTLRDSGFKIHIATARPLRSRTFVMNWLEHMRIQYDSFHSLGPYRYKAEIVCDALVDDAPEQIEKFVEDGRVGFLYEQPWNSEAKIPKSIRIQNLEELIEYFVKK
jgi:5'(3')-deoxyribonucleotidase